MKTKNKILLAIDIDGTLIPNSTETPNFDGIKKFGKLLEENPQFILCYPTGRTFQMACEAIEKYLLPMPDFLIPFNGAALYRRNGKKWEEDKKYRQKISASNSDFNKEKIISILSQSKDLKIQEDSKQHQFKAGFYVDLKIDSGKITKEARKLLEKNGIKEIKIIYSQDLKGKTGILEILADNISKLAGIEYLLEHPLQLPLIKGERKSDSSPNPSSQKMEEISVVFAGDEGNDLDVFASGIPSILVGNAREEIKTKARQMNLNSIYFAQGKEIEGVLEGLKSIAPLC
ncbi:MAG: HAD-IIB family hydrolase [bacterium]